MKAFRFGITLVAAAAFAAAVIPAGCASGERDYGRERERMVAWQIASRGIRDARVLAAMRTVPRHRFVPAGMRDLAYRDHPLPIGSGQTISQPYIVALMTESMRVGKGDRVLEVGTGSGYQAAVLAEIVDTVYTIEILPELAERARALLDTLGYGNVIVRAGDGYDGWPERSPFDAVIVTAAAPRVPEPLVEQLAAGGRIVIPVGDDFQELMIYEKRAGGLELIATLPVRFVPMKGKVRDSKVRDR